MKCYTTHGGLLTPGLDVVSNERLGPVVALGELGRGRTLTRVKLDRREPPITIPAHVCPTCGLQAGWCYQHPSPALPRVLEADIVAYEAAGHAQHALARALGLDERSLIRCNTGAAYIRGARGCTEPYWGSPSRVTGGHGAFGDAGRVGTWTDELWILAPGEALLVRPSRGSAWVVWDSDDEAPPRVWAPEDWRTAVRESVIPVLTAERRERELRLSTERRHEKLIALFASAEGRRL